ncbi:EMBRYO SURROUNDING FACTOR 1-like protein 9 [Brassica napus]|nr:EMBRYO SURROUNDING FACTOR 1-like protein 9 [Brassica napus]
MCIINNMSSSQFAIFCVIWIALSPLHEFVDAAKGTCNQTTCPKLKTKDKTCICCSSDKRCYPTKQRCGGWCA